MGNRLAGKTAVVTGAAGALGGAIAVRLAAEGANLVVVGSGRSPLDAVRVAVEAEGAKVEAVEGDVATPEGVTAYLDAADQLGGVDVLVSNAGVQAGIMPLTDLEEDSFDTIMRVNVRSVFLGLKYAGPRMAARGGGVIVNVASVAGLRGVPLIAAYCASKHAIIGLTKAAAAELAGSGVRVNALAPGVIESPMMRDIENGAAPGAPEQAKAAYTALTQLGRYGSPEEVASAAAFLASDESSYMTGGYLRFDGGMAVDSA
ncbi:SDR family NAD(P)-dependent oxidoreductase [Xylanimonas ulmi]|nr:glucose 1-dehydrogenase [Xylanibacterium ulmi]